MLKSHRYSLFCLTVLGGLLWTMSLHPNSYVKALIPSVTVFGDGACKKIIKEDSSLLVTWDDAQFMNWLIKSIIS